MKTTTVRELLRNHDQFVSIVQAGESVMVTKHEKPIYQMMPVKKRRGKMPDILGRLKAIYGDEVIPHERMMEIHRENKGTE
ncbi:MAG: hypothetical protein ABIQ35_08910 [Verrucomicrobiota bacterium]